MKWFRSKIKHGARLALLALAVQFVLSFGHAHWFAAQAAQTVQSATTPAGAGSLKVQADQAARRQLPGNRHSDQQPADNCAVCAVIAMASTVLFAAPPLLMLPEAVRFLYRATDAEFVHLNSAGAAFQPRAPPAS